MSIPDPIDFLAAVSGFTLAAKRSSADRPIRLAVIDPAYVGLSGAAARVTFEGESTLSGKAYPLADGFLPVPGQRVYLVPIGTTYLIAGSIGGQRAQGFWQSSTSAGAVVRELSVTESMSYAGWNMGRGLVALAHSSSNSAAYTGLAAVLTLATSTLKAGRAYEFRHGNTVQHTATGICHVQIHCTEMAGYVVDWGRYPITLAGQVVTCRGDQGFVRNNTASDINRTFALHMGASSGSGFHAAAATARRRFLELWDVGRAADFPHATEVT